MSETHKPTPTAEYYQRAKLLAYARDGLVVRWSDVLTNNVPLSSKLAVLVDGIFFSRRVG